VIIIKFVRFDRFIGGGVNGDSFNGSRKAPIKFAGFFGSPAEEAAVYQERKSTSTI
jgi:hypothetical protein